MNTPGRADDEHAAGLVAAPVAVEQVRRAVQRHDRLAGAGTAADRARRPCWARGSRGPARPGWSRRSSASSGRGPGTAGPAGHPRRRSAGPVSGPRGRAGRPRRRARGRPCCAGSGGVRRPAGRPAWPGRTPPRRERASRSAARRSSRRAGRSGRCSAGPSLTSATHVEPPEDQPLVGGVERRHPPGRLEDHGVALDETALVADPAARRGPPWRAPGRTTAAFSSWV